MQIIVNLTPSYILSIDEPHSFPTENSWINWDASIESYAQKLRGLLFKSYPEAFIEVHIAHIYHHSAKQIHVCQAPLKCKYTIKKLMDGLRDSKEEWVIDRSMCNLGRELNSIPIHYLTGIFERNRHEAEGELWTILPSLGRILSKKEDKISFLRGIFSYFFDLPGFNDDEFLAKKAATDVVNTLDNFKVQNQ